MVVVFGGRGMRGGGVGCRQQGTQNESWSASRLVFQVECNEPTILDVLNINQMSGCSLIWAAVAWVVHVVDMAMVCHKPHEN